MKPTNYLRYVAERRDPLGHLVCEDFSTDFFTIEQWWEHELGDEVNAVGGEWLPVKMENFDGNQPPEGWAHPGFSNS